MEMRWRGRGITSQMDPFLSLSLILSLSHSLSLSLSLILSLSLSFYQEIQYNEMITHGFSLSLSPNELMRSLSHSGREREREGEREKLIAAIVQNSVSD